MLSRKGLDKKFTIALEHGIIKRWKDIYDAIDKNEKAICDYIEKVIYTYAEKILLSRRVYISRRTWSRKRRLKASQKKKTQKFSKTKKFLMYKKVKQVRNVFMSLLDDIDDIGDKKKSKEDCYKIIETEYYPPAIWKDVFEKLDQNEKEVLSNIDDLITDFELIPHPKALKQCIMDNPIPFKIKHCITFPKNVDEIKGKFFNLSQKIRSCQAKKSIYKKKLKKLLQKLDFKGDIEKIYQILENGMIPFHNGHYTIEKQKHLKKIKISHSSMGADEQDRLNQQEKLTGQNIDNQNFIKLERLNGECFIFHSPSDMGGKSLDDFNGDDYLLWISPSSYLMNKYLVDYVAFPRILYFDFSENDIQLEFPVKKYDVPFFGESDFDSGELYEAIKHKGRFIDQYLQQKGIHKAEDIYPIFHQILKDRNLINSKRLNHLPKDIQKKMLYDRKKAKKTKLHSVNRRFLSLCYPDIIKQYYCIDAKTVGKYYKPFFGRLSTGEIVQVFEDKYHEIWKVSKKMNAKSPYVKGSEFERKSQKVYGKDQKIWVFGTKYFINTNSDYIDMSLKSKSCDKLGNIFSFPPVITTEEAQKIKKYREESGNNTLKLFLIDENTNQKDLRSKKCKNKELQDEKKAYVIPFGYADCIETTFNKHYGIIMVAQRIVSSKKKAVYEKTQEIVQIIENTCGSSVTLESLRDITNLDLINLELMELERKNRGLTPKEFLQKLSETTITWEKSPERLWKMYKENKPKMPDSGKKNTL